MKGLLELNPMSILSTLSLSLSLTFHKAAEGRKTEIISCKAKGHV